VLHRTAAFCFTLLRSTLFEIALVLVRFDHLTSGIVNANQTICQTIPRARAYGRLFTVCSTVEQNSAAKRCNPTQHTANAESPNIRRKQRCAKQ
jgi:hypothetical protein